MVAAGKAQVTVSFDAWKEGQVAAARQEIAIEPATADSPLAPVSERLVRELIHTNQQGTLQGLRFSPDGKRIVAGDTSAGIIQIWDVASGKPLTRIETGKAKMGKGGGRGGSSFVLSPDWQKLYAKKGAQVGVWDPQSGRQIDTLEDKQAGAAQSLMLSSDGNVLIAGAGKGAASVWDLSTRKAQPLTADVSLASGALSRDGKYFAGPVQGDGYYTSAIQVIDLGTRQVSTTIAIPQKLARAYVTDFSPDGKLIRGAIEIYDEHLWQKWEKWQYITKFWDAATGKEVASIPADESETSYSMLVYSPDGKALAATRWTPRKGTRAEKLHANLRNGAKLFLLDIPGKQVRGIILQENAVVGAIAFSPDSRWVAAVSQPRGKTADNEAGDVDNLLQPRIHLVDAHTARVRETLIAPHGPITALSFSPDGKTLASAGSGKALLWSLTPAPNELLPKR
jgi:WD40 repeat protein